MAASALGIKAGKAYVEISADNTKLMKGMRDAQQRMTRMADGLRAVGTRMAAMGLGGMAGFGMAMKQFGEFETSLAAIAAIKFLAAPGHLGPLAESAGVDPADFLAKIDQLAIVLISIIVLFAFGLADDVKHLGRFSNSSFSSLLHLLLLSSVILELSCSSKAE